MPYLGNEVAPLVQALEGKELKLDSDGDSSITADTDDRVDVKVGGSDIAHVTSTGLGVGTTSPSHELHITGSSDTRAIITSGGSGDASTRLFYYFNAGQLGASSGTVNYGLASEQFRDVTGWSHFVLKHTGGVTTAYHNGTSFHTWSISGNTAITATQIHGVGCRGGSGSGAELDGYLAETHLVDGTAYEPTQFAEEKNGVWIPKDPSGTSYGTNGFYLKYENASDLGNDSSGNNNDLTSNMGSDHQVLESPSFGS